ncbi:transglutaminase domain-containing protein [Endozoicomonas ascidiicola]|uniref:transglutaminase domain-containing protein n=1 Tax=Endozoicomonas ascidiicola TaxID=1698521 RepID=UPI00082E1D14|nr:transglutaminase domain-containing protein [Endozoicomonas ascidiicola]
MKRRRANDIMQANPTCNGLPLGDSIHRLFLVNDDMLKGRQAANPDLWRRLGQMKEVSDTVAEPSSSCSDDDLLDQLEQMGHGESGYSTVIDFAAEPDWQHALFGGITLDARGQLYFSSGKLGNLTASTHLTLQNAPWEDKAFKSAITDALRAGGFYVDRQWVSLPEGLTLSREAVSDEQLGQLKKSAIEKAEMFSVEKTSVCLNSAMVKSLKHSVKVEGTSVVQANALSDLMGGAGQLVVTSVLSKEDWLWLFGQLEALPESTRPALFNDIPPTQLTTESSHCQVIDRSELKTDSNSDQAFHYSFTTSDSLESLQQVKLISKQDFTFSVITSPLMDCLLKGTPVVLDGLERKPELAAMLETLLLPDPYLFLHGQKIPLPKARVTLVKPEDGLETGSRLFNQVFLSNASVAAKSGNPFYRLLQELPSSLQRRYPSRPPWTPASFQEQLDKKSEEERKLDGDAVVKPAHQRRALNSLVAKAYRGDDKVYSFIKAKAAQYFPDQPAEMRADHAALRQWFAANPKPTVETVKDSFWQLARHCPSHVHEAINELHTIDDNAIKQLATVLIGAAPISQQQELAKQFKVPFRKVVGQSFYDGNVVSNIRDLLIANRHQLAPGTVINDAVTLLEHQVSVILKASVPEAEKRLELSKTFGAFFSDGKLPDGYQDLPDALMTGQRHSKARQERRIAQLARRIKDIVFIQGEAGAGKTFMAKAIASRAGYPDCQVLQLSPNVTSDEIFGGQRVINQVNDHSTEFQEGPILKWAMSENPPLLLLDEANLAPDGLLSPLAGLTGRPPVIDYQGRQYPLTERHRIVLTGNPDHYEGRHLDDVLKTRIPTLFYHPLSEAVLAESIIRPGLPANWSDKQKQQASERLLTLFNQFRELVPGDLMTPRDIKDTLASVRQLLRYQQGPVILDAQDISEEQINALIHKAFMDSLSGAVTGSQRQQLESLNHWYQGQFPEDTSILNGVNRAFSAFMEMLQKNNPEGDFGTEPIRKLVYNYWQSLEKDDYGRVSVLVEGPAGWGKDFILDRTIQQWQQEQSANRPMVHINANLHQWPKLVEKVREAMTRGHILAISELNLIPSHYLEGLFNDVLTGYAAPGFRLFGTINPGSFDGRESLSPALKSRCTQIKLEHLSRSDLEGLISRQKEVPEGLSEWLADRFYQLSLALREQGSPIQPALDDLFGCTRYLAAQPANQWQDGFIEHLSLAHRSLESPLNVDENLRSTLDQQQKTEQWRLTQERLVNQAEGLKEPITVKFGNEVKLRKNYMMVAREVIGESIYPQFLAQYFSSDEKEKGARKNPLNNKVSSVVGEKEANPHRNAQATIYFQGQGFKPDQYRLGLSAIRYNDGQLMQYPISWEYGGLQDISPEFSQLAWREDLYNEEVPGQISLTLSNQWHPLPSLSAMDSLQAIQVTPETDIDVKRSDKTGQLMIALADRNGAPVNAVVDFIVAPDADYFSQLDDNIPVELQSGLGSSTINQFLEKNVVNPINGEMAFQELNDIHNISNIPKRLKALRDWLESFSETKKRVSENGEDLLSRVLGTKQGSGSDKLAVFHLLCDFWGIPSRIVDNERNGFVEVSPDLGEKWHYYPVERSHYFSEDIQPEWPEYQKTKGSLTSNPASKQAERDKPAFKTPVGRPPKSSSTGSNHVRKSPWSAKPAANNLMTSLLPQTLSFGDITGTSNFEVDRYFPEYPYDARQYRLKLSETILDADGQLRSYPITWVDIEVEALPSVTEFPWRADLKVDELPGKIALNLTGDWQPLPSLTPEDDLRGIRTKPDVTIELGRSGSTGQLLIRSLASETMDTVVDFIVAPQQSYYEQLEPNDFIAFQDDLCSPALKALFDEHIFSQNDDVEAFDQLRWINNADDTSERLQTLMEWLDSFSVNANVSGNGSELLLNILREKQGVCRHKAMVFQMLCHYWGVPARTVSNASHAFVEISSDGGQSWRQYQVGGGGNSESVVSEPDWTDYNNSGFSELAASNERKKRNYDPFGQGLERGSETTGTEVSSSSNNKSEADSEVYDHPSGKNSVQPSSKSFKEYFEKLHSKIDCNGFLFKHIDRFNKELEQDTVDSGLLAELKIKMQAELNLMDEGDPPAFLGNWSVLLSFPAYRYIHGDNEWVSIIKRALLHSPLVLEKHTYASMIKSEIQNHFFRAEKQNRLKTYMSPTQFDHINLDLESSSLQDNYIDWFLGLCEENIQLSQIFISDFQKLSGSPDFVAYKERVNRLLDKMPYPSFDRIKPLDVITEEEALLTSFASTLPRSQYLSAKIGSNRIDRKYTHAPESNSRLAPERLAKGLPAFVNESVHKSYKPVIFNMCHIDHLQMKTLSRELAYCIHYDFDNKDRNELYNAYCKGFVRADRSDSTVTNYPDFINRKGSYKKIFNLDLFITWLCQTQKDCRNTTWRWLFNDYQGCIEQDNGIKLPYGILDDQNEYKYTVKFVDVMKYSKQQIRDNFQEPSAVVLNNHDILMMYEEFVQVMKAAMVE